MKISKKEEITKTIKKETRMTRRFNKLRIKGDEVQKCGVLYIGHLPKGFAEDELKKFFV